VFFHLRHFTANIHMKALSSAMRPLSIHWAVAALTPLVLMASSSVMAQAKVGTPEAGKTKIAMCIGCHGIPGYQASFPEVHKVPMIAGQSAKYLAAALTGYQKGDRKHPTMKGIAATLSEQDILDVAAYYEVQGKDLPARPARQAKPSAEVAALLQRGNCAACHGENMNKPVDASYPKLAGQHGDYLLVALKSYQNDKSASIGRTNAIMAGQVKGFTAKELKLLAYYIEGLGGDLKTVTQNKFR